MPKSKRARVVSLTAVKKARTGGAGSRKERHLQRVRDLVDEYPRVYVFAYGSLPTVAIHDIKEQWTPARGARILMGKNSLMRVAFGRTEAEEIVPGSSLLVPYLRGKVGLLFTNTSVDEATVVEYFEGYSRTGFAATNYRVDRDVEIPEGILEQFDFSLEGQLRALGLPTALKNGRIHLITNYKLCSAGQKLTPEQARLLKMFGYELANYQLELRCGLVNGDFSPYRDPPRAGANADEEDLIEFDPADMIVEDHVSEEDSEDDDDDEEEEVKPKAAPVKKAAAPVPVKGSKKPVPESDSDEDDDEDEDEDDEDDDDDDDDEDDDDEDDDDSEFEDESEDEKPIKGKGAAAPKGKSAPARPVRVAGKPVVAVAAAKKRTHSQSKR